MSYLITESPYGREEKRIDRAALARDVAAILGGTVEAEPGTYGTVRLTINGCYVGFHAEHGAKVNRVRVSAFPPHEMAQKVRASGFKHPDFPRITVDGTRDAAALAKDIACRVIEPARIAMGEMLASVESAGEARRNLDVLAAELCKSAPGVSVTFADADALEASLYGTNGQTYFSGRMNRDGAVYVDRMGTLPPETARAVLGLLFSKPSASL